MSKDLSEWVEEDSLERYVSDTIDYLDTEGRLEPFYPEPREDGRERPTERLSQRNSSLSRRLAVETADRLLAAVPPLTSVNSWRHRSTTGLSDQ